jgi:hypothetical protein
LKSNEESIDKCQLDAVNAVFFLYV